jgi:hypothetical protein
MGAATTPAEHRCGEAIMRWQICHLPSLDARSAVKPTEKKWRVSVWVGFVKGDPNVDVLKHLCGVRSYDLDFQEIIIDDEGWKQQSIESLLQQLSYSGTFLDVALSAAKAKNITKALYVLAQYRFVYDPARIKNKIAADPLFLGCFTWNDAEDAQNIQRYLDAMNAEDD